ncbi:MAG: hypothetical protein LH619_12160 [Chitinophagaceae bacterium]|nr:hypothetical protein [Chitinophagaceae bacterium]
MKDYMLKGNPVKKCCKGLLSVVFLSLLILFTTNLQAQGDLMLYPKRIIFEGSKRSQEINLANSGKDTARYVLSVVQIRMKEDGSFETITDPDPGQNFADKYFRIFPRNVVLPPNEAQTVKVQLINTGEMQPGEYRSHLYVRAEEEKKPLGEEDTLNDAKTISVKIKAVFGISIPVIIRSGENTSKINISDVSFIQEKEVPATLRFTFNRNGNMSVYGDVLVDYISPDGKKIRVGAANGLSVYTPTTKRNFNLSLTQTPGVDFHKGSLQVTYRYNAANADLLAEGKIALQ